MKVFADLHIHSKYSGATSAKMDVENLEKGAREKGLNLLGTGDFLHPNWLKELKSNLIEDGSGILKTGSGFNFLLTCEVNNVFEHEGKIRKVHNLILAKSFEVVEQIREALGRFGDLNKDGRPTLNLTCAELLEILSGIDKDIEVIPAHCLLPNEYIHCNSSLKPISEIKSGDYVLTHRGRFRKVKKIYRRLYKGYVYKVIPFYFSEGITVTPEHPIYAIKTFKNCRWINGVCKPICSQSLKCGRKYFLGYYPTWIQARDLEVGDVLIFPRMNEIVKDVKYIDIGRYAGVSKKIAVNKEFCRLVGYYLAEGFTNNRDGIGFSFGDTKEERKYERDVINLMEKIFGLSPKIDRKKRTTFFYSRTLVRFFRDNFYGDGEKRAWNKKLPNWMLYLPFEKQAEIFKGWWRGDKGYTTSRILMNQMKFICLRLGIIPCIKVDSVESHRRRGKHFIEEREIKANNPCYVFNHLTFFEDSFNLLEDSCFSKFISKTKRRYGWIDKNYIYLPILRIEKIFYSGYVYNLEVEEDNSYLSEFAVLHNCWTPWYGVFGSKSGFDDLKECYQDKTDLIHALETGLSSDPEMNWAVSKLDKYNLVSNSDSHSPSPFRLGREANVFELKELTYKEILKAIREKNPKRFLFTVEVDPSYGKYHWDGHRKCGVCLPPEEAKKFNNLCPVCGKPLTLGVLHRVLDLADRPLGYKPKNAIPFKRILPLQELISVYYKTEPGSKKVLQIYQKLIKHFGSEFSVLLEVEKKEMEKVIDEKLANLIIKNREGRIKIKPGYDGVYGKIVLDEEEVEEKKSPQKGLFEF